MSAAVTPQRRRQPLRRRLTLGLVVLVLLVLIAAGLAMMLAVRAFLMDQLDREVVSTATSLAVNESFDPAGLRDGTVVVETDASGRLVQPPVIVGRPGDGDGDDSHVGDRDGEHDRRQVTSEDLADLTAATSEPSSVALATLGPYRAVEVPDSQGHIITLALPLDQVNETLGRLLLIEGLTLAAAGLVVAFGGGWLIRRELIPLDRVAKTARAVSALPLSSGSTKLDQRVPAGDVGTEVGDVANALNEMLEHVDVSLAQRAETERQLRQFVADASHELRTPLTSIRGYAELYRRPDIDTDGQRTAMARIESEASRMGTLVDDLLLLARLDQGRPLLHEPVDVCNLVAETVSDIAVSAQDHAISVDLPEAAVFIVGDEGRLRQVLGNLVANAVQHTPAGTSVAVTVAVEGDNVVISVADSGPGVPADFQPHAFERFTRADESRARSSGGSGLGLSIAAAVVRALDGTVALTSEPGRTVVSVTLQQSADRRA